MIITLGLLLVLLATPLVSAVPGAEKNNDKFDYFELICSGIGDTSTGIVVDTYLNDLVKTRLISDRGWITGGTVDLTVGDETFTSATAPYSADYTTTFDAQMVFNNDGTQKQTNIKLTDVITLYYEDEAIGKLVLKIAATIEFTDGVASGYRGTVVGYGIEALEGVHLSAMDLGLISRPPPLFGRVGTTTGWPEQITNPI